MLKCITQNSWRGGLWKVVSVLVVLSGCERPTPTAPLATPDVPVRSGTSTAADAGVDSVAHALALALSDNTIRQHLLEDLRDSPNPEHALHFRSYLAGTRGRTLLDAGASAAHMTPDAFLGFVKQLPDLQLVVERPIDRVRWTGGSDIAVYGTSMPRNTRSGISTELGFRLNGDTISIPVSTYAPFTYVTLEPSRMRSGSDPEQARAGAAHQSRSSISTKDEEMRPSTMTSSRTIVPCDDCTDPGGGTPDGIALNSLYTNAYCIGTAGQFSASEDADIDGVRDNCEAALAQAFRPMLAMNNADAAPDMEPYWAVTKTYGSSYGSTLKIFYALSYYRDPGDPNFIVDAHDGDSEFIVVGVSSTGASRWHLDYETLSAHWGAGSSVDETATYGYASVEFPNEYRGRPRVWVSMNKHANYRSKSVCNSMPQDRCDNVFEWTVYRDAEILSSANLGDVWDHYRDFTQAGAGRMRDCFTSRTPWMSDGGTECYWYPTAGQDFFAGWHGDHGQAKATAYNVMLSWWSF